MYYFKRSLFSLLIVSLTLAFQTAGAQHVSPASGPPALSASSKPWVLWYWMHASMSKEGITRELEAMKANGIEGAYIASIKGKTDPPLYTPVREQLSPEWWEMVKYAVQEAGRLGLKVAMLTSDGFATAGGPWITPAESMQKVVWTETRVSGGKLFNDTLARPESYMGYYNDIAVLAYPTPSGAGKSSYTTVPQVSTNKPGIDPSFLAKKGNKQNFGSNEPCWIQYAFEKPFTVRTIRIRVNNFNHQSQRLKIEVSNDGKNFRQAGRLEPPRAGWLDWDADVTHSIEPVTARFFRFVYDPEGTEPGAEDLDAAKWKPSLKIAGIELLSEAKINQFEGKSGEVWRVGKRSTAAQLADSLCVPLDKVIDISSYMSADGRLNWKAPKGNWTILRMGHTSTGHKNETAGAGKGLESDKFNPQVVKKQFDNWFGQALRTVGPELAGKVLHILYNDSWECGSQNWSPVFREQFQKRRGYDLINYLPAMAGVPLQSAEVSERFLYDVRQTIAELVNDGFFKTMHQLAHENGCVFYSETTAPVMTTDGLAHFGVVDVPMGEFWLRSPSHDKPNDMLDAISGARIYGKPIVQAEAFTQIRMAWDEHPGNLKALQDRNYALGVNRLIYHVFTHNPWLDRKPGMTLDGVGLYFQPDQTWWKPGKEWVSYASRTQEILQRGVPVVDVAVFTGEELPRRAILPDRLVNTLPGVFGKEVVEAEKKRLANKGLPMRTMPAGVNTLANMSDPQDWLDPLRGYAYDSFNPDALLRLAKVSDGKVRFGSENGYGIIVLPGAHQMQPHANLMSAEVATKLLQLVKEGATLVIGERPLADPGLDRNGSKDAQLKRAVEELWGGSFKELSDGHEKIWMKELGKGKVVKGPYKAASFEKLGLSRDVVIRNNKGQAAAGFAWTHRRDAAGDIYFISNQDSVLKQVSVSLRVSGKQPVLYNAVTNERTRLQNWTETSGRSEMTLQFEPNGSLFILLEEEAAAPVQAKGLNWKVMKTEQTLNEAWKVSFDKSLGGPENAVEFKQLSDWSAHADTSIRYYSGTAVYESSFKWKKKAAAGPVWLDLGEVANIAEVQINGVDCGTAWTAPYRVDISKALKKGKNSIRIELSNTWANRLIGDQRLPEDRRITRTTAPYRLGKGPLVKAGLLGPLKIMTEE